MPPNLKKVIIFVALDLGGTTAVQLIIILSIILAILIPLSCILDRLSFQVLEAEEVALEK